MADPRGDGSLDAPWDPVDAAYWPDDQPVNSAETAPTWSVYDGRPESVSDGVESMPSPAPGLQRRWPWAVAGVVTAAGVLAAAIIIVGATVVVTPRSEGTESHEAPVVAPAQWQRVDPSLTAGLVIVNGGAEADGIVLTSSGLVATSYARIMGDLRPPADGFQLLVAADGQDAVPATILRSDAATDIALVQAPGFVPPSVAKPGTPARVGDTLTLLDDQGGNQPVVGIGVTVTATNHVCSRAGSTGHPRGFQFSLEVASAEPGAALVRPDGTVVGMYYGGNDTTHHCAIPIADLLEAIPAG